MRSWVNIYMVPFFSDVWEIFMYVYKKILSVVELTRTIRNIMILGNDRERSTKKEIGSARMLETFQGLNFNTALKQDDYCDMHKKRVVKEYIRLILGEIKIFTRSENSCSMLA